MNQPLDYLLFAGSTHYPGGGVEDFIVSLKDYAPLLELGAAGLREGKWDWFHIVQVGYMNKIAYGDINGVFYEGTVQTHKGMGDKFEKIIRE